MGNVVSQLCSKSDDKPESVEFKPDEELAPDDEVILSNSIRNSIDWQKIDKGKINLKKSIFK